MIPIGQIFAAATLSASLVYDLVAQHTVSNYASIATPAAATVTCLTARGPATPDSYATCYLFAPGFRGNLPAGSAVLTAGPGTVRLGCDGYPYPVACSARVDR